TDLFSGTYYGTGLGACGITNKDTDFIAAAAESLFDSFPGATANPNNNPICGKKVLAQYEGKSVEVTITDRCGGCTLEGSLDFSPSAFSQLADMSVGRIHGMTWQFIS
ncbi:plant expansin, partial [Schizopora paradoxa]